MDQAERRSHRVGLRMRVREPLAALGGDVDRDTGRQGAAALGGALAQLRHVGAGDVFHREEVLVLSRLAEVEHLDDVRVRELGDELRFRDEHLDELRVLREMRQHALDGERLLEAGGAAGLGLPDFRHAADGDAAEQRVPAEGGHGRGL